jgi:hypothetical protein
LEVALVSFENSQSTTEFTDMMLQGKQPFAAIGQAMSVSQGMSGAFT